MDIRRNGDLQLWRLTASRDRNTSMNYVVLQVIPMLGVKRRGGWLLPSWQKRLSSGYSQAAPAASPLRAVSWDCDNLNITFGRRHFVFRVDQLREDSWLQ